MHGRPGDGAAAVTALKQSAFDLVLLDVMMPGPDGFETLRSYPQLQPGTGHHADRSK